MTGCCLPSREVQARGGHHQLAMLYPLGADQFVGELSDFRGTASNDGNLQAVVSIQMNMEDGNDGVVMVVLMFSKFV